MIWSTAEGVDIVDFDAIIYVAKSVVVILERSSKQNEFYVSHF